MLFWRVGSRSFKREMMFSSRLIICLKCCDGRSNEYFSCVAALEKEACPVCSSIRFLIKSLVRGDKWSKSANLKESGQHSEEIAVGGLLVASINLSIFSCLATFWKGGED